MIRNSLVGVIPRALISRICLAEDDAVARYFVMCLFLKRNINLEAYGMMKRYNRVLYINRVGAILAHKGSTIINNLLKSKQPF